MKQNIETTTSSVANEAIDFRQPIIPKKDKKSKQQSKHMKTKKNLSRSVHTNNKVNKSHATTIDSSLDYINVPDQTFYEMLLTAFANADKLDYYFSNEKEKIEFVRHYTGLIDRLSYVKLQQLQWDWYHHIGITHNIWTNRISKHIAEKNSICYTYGRSKTMIEQHRQQIRKQLQEAGNTIKLFEQQILF